MNLDLKYGDNQISTYGAFLGGIDYDSTEEFSGLGTAESTTFLPAMSEFKEDNGLKYTDTLKRELVFAFYNGITRMEYAEFAEAFFNSFYFKKMIFCDDEVLGNYYFMAKLINPMPREINGKIVHIKCDVEYDSPYGYEINDAEYNFTSAGNIVINNTSHRDSKLYPNLEIKGTGQISIEDTTNGSKFIITLNSGETVTVSDKHKVKSDNAEIAHKLLDCDLTNGSFLYLNKGANNLTIGGTGTLSYVKITFPICKKVGA